MGTRAIITKNGKPFIATHWDGYPEALGADLLGKVTDDEIIKVSAERSIDFIDQKYKAKAIKFLKARQMREARKVVSDGYSLTLKEAKRLYPVSADDIKHYGDWAEWHYDLKDGKWTARPLSGAYPDSFDTLEKLEPLEIIIEKIVKKQDPKGAWARVLTQRIAMERKRIGNIPVKSHIRKTKKGQTRVKRHMRR